MRSLLVRPLIGLLLCASAAVAARGTQSVVVLGGDGLPARESTPPPTGTGLIMGRTVDADSGRPISGATVTLFRAGSTGYEPVMTDAQGRFVFSSLGAGTLTLRANKPGYLDGAYAKVLPNDQSDSGQPLDLADDERLGEVTIKLWKYAVVGGTVLDETGEPMVGVAVRAMPKKFIGGRLQFSIERVAGATARTDDRGQFRLSTLAPGDYVFVVPVITTTWARTLLLPGPTSQRSANYVESGGSLSTWLGGSSSGAGGGSTSLGDDRFTVVDSSNRPSSIGNPPSIAGVNADGTILAYETTFHPASNVLARAAVVTLRSGEERSGIDFRMRPVPSVRVSGTLMGPDGPAGEFVLRLVQTEISAVTTSDPEVAQTVTQSDGRFSFYGVAPGQYQIRGLKVPRPPAGQLVTDSSTSIRTGGGDGGLMIINSSGGRALPSLPTLWADTPVVVGDRNVDEAIVTLQTGFRIRGRIEFEGAAQKPAAPSLTVYVERADGAGSSNSGLAIGRSDEQGQFATQGQRPGKYYVRMPYVPAGSYFKSAMLGTSDISAVPTDLSRDIEGVVITLSDKPATRLAGLVTDSKGQPQLAGMVVVFTANQQLWGNSGQTARNIISAGVGKGGRYTVTNLPPGDYFVVALGEAVAGWADPKLLAAWSRTAARVTLAEGAVKTQDVGVTTTPAKDPSPLHEPEDAVEGHGPFVIEPREEVADQTPPPPVQSRDVPPPTVGAAVIAGVVVSDDKARQPIRRAHVTLTGTTVAFGTRTITTDETGRFAFTDLPAGRFGLSASKAAYLAANYGAKEFGRQGTTITLTEAQRFVDITLPMARGAVITGVIRDQAGQPVPAVTVQALQYRFTTGGQRELGMGSAIALVRAETDDRGQYRFYGLTPGEYVIGAAPRFNAGAARQIVEADVQAATQALKLTRTSSPVAGAGRGAAAQSPPSSRGRSFNYTPVFFPGTTIAADATMVTVAKGEEKTGVDIALQLVPTALVEGVVTNLGGALPSNLEVRLVAVSRVGPTPLDIGALLPVRPRVDGKFSYTGVAPGQYAVVALAPAAPTGRGGAASAGPATSLWATAELNVNGVDVTGVALSLQPGMTVSGKVTTDAKTLTPPTDFTGTRVSLQAILTGSQVSAGSLTATVGADGSFVLKGIMPGRYKITSTLGSPGVTGGALVTGWMLRSAMVGGRDASEESFEVPGGTDVGDIVITFTDRPSEVSGALQDATGRLATDYFIIVFPADRALWGAGARRVAQARPASDGRFAVRSLKAGSYLIAAATDVEPGAINDPDFLEQLVAGAVKFELAEGEKKVQDIRIAKW